MGSLKPQGLRLEDLTNVAAEDRLAVLNNCLKDLIRELGEAGVTYHDLEDISGVDENTIKQFMFRKPRRPRATELIKKLSSAVGSLSAAGRIARTPALAIFEYLYQARFPRHEAVARQLNLFYSFLANKFGQKAGLELGAIAFASGDGIVDQSYARSLRFFCYKKSKLSPMYIEKSEYIFFTDDSFRKDECFFSESRQEDDGSILERHGIARMTDNLISLFSFQESDCVTTHIKCFPDKSRAHAVTVFGDAKGLAVELAVFVPEYRVPNKGLGFVDSQSNSAAEELQDFKDGLREFLGGI